VIFLIGIGPRTVQSDFIPPKYRVGPTEQRYLTPGLQFVKRKKGLPTTQKPRRKPHSEETPLKSQLAPSEYVASAGSLGAFSFSHTDCPTEID